jgi:hypothetical protein
LPGSSLIDPNASADEQFEFVPWRNPAVQLVEGTGLARYLDADYLLRVIKNIRLVGRSVASATKSVYRPIASRRPPRFGDSSPPVIASHPPYTT